MSDTILGIDPGSRKTGYGFVRREGNRIHHLDNGVLQLSARAPLAERLLELHTGLMALIGRHHPTIAALEHIYFARNPQSALKLGHARGVALLAAISGGLKVFEYSPAEIKRTVTTTGRAEKGQVQRMVQILLGLPEIAQEDASDALAAAICYCHRTPPERDTSR